MGTTEQCALVICLLLPATLEATFPFERCGLVWRVCWKGREGAGQMGVNERHWKAQWSCDANCFYSHSSSLPVSDFSTSNDLPLLLSLSSLLSLSPSPPSILLLPLFHVIFFNFISHSSRSPLHESTSPYSFARSLSYIPLSASEEFLLHLFACGGEMKGEAGTHWR